MNASIKVVGWPHHPDCLAARYRDQGLLGACRIPAMYLPSPDLPRRTA